MPDGKPAGGYGNISEKVKACFLFDRNDGMESVKETKAMAIVELKGLTRVYISGDHE